MDFEFTFGKFKKFEKSKNNCFDNFLSVNKYIYSVKEKINRAHRPYRI